MTVPLICNVAVEFLGSCEVALDPVVLLLPEDEDEGAAEVLNEVWITKEERMGEVD